MGFSQESEEVLVPIMSDPNEPVRTRFRWINLRIRELNPEADRKSVDFVCECPNEHCFSAVRMAAAEFDRRCAEGGWLVAHAHTQAYRPAA